MQTRKFHVEEPTRKHVCTGSTLDEPQRKGEGVMYDRAFATKNCLESLDSAARRVIWSLPL